ncbi:MAG: hypothetical protein CL910_13970 [Deltaproteobacteria bacterium]|nr:hypothetical protein [Deltaproteobacteria bacterium]
MEQTWESHAQSKLSLLDAANGDVVVCSLSARPDQLSAALPGERVCFVSPLRNRSETEWLLRGLHLHPKVRHLVLCGEDHRATGAALVALLEEGLDDAGRLPGSRGSLAPDLGRASVDALRSQLQVSDWREKPMDDVARGILDLPSLSESRSARSHQVGSAPERKPFLSRRSSFPLFTSDIADGWLQLLNLVTRIGTEATTEKGDHFAEAMNAIVTVEHPEEETPLPAFLDLDTADLDALQRRFSASLPAWEGLDQLESALAGHGSASVAFNVVEEKLFASFVFRSCDVYTEWPLEASVLVGFQREAAERLGLGLGSSTFIIHSARLFHWDWERAQRVLGESFKRPLPLQIDPSGIFLFGNDGGEARAMLLAHDASAIFWEEAFSDPEDLSWYIIDVMPWLLPQHMRYVGQECAALMRAIREGECYEQG